MQSVSIGRQGSKIASMANLALAFQKLLLIEGGYNKVVGDAGGDTKFGIAAAVLSAYYGRPATTSDVQNLDEATAQEVYRQIFWDPTHLDEINDQDVAYAIFDQVVNRGSFNVIKDAQIVLVGLGCAPIAVDGVMGPMTFNALNGKVSPKVFLLAFFVRCQLSYGKIVAGDTTLAKFLCGWLSRTHRILNLVVS